MQGQLTSATTILIAKQKRGCISPCYISLRPSQDFGVSVKKLVPNHFQIADARDMISQH
jgi:dethiobiotin synthetase